MDLTFYKFRVLKGALREVVGFWGFFFSMATQGSLFSDKLLFVLGWYLTEAMKISGEGDQTGFVLFFNYKKRGLLGGSVD